MRTRRLIACGLAALSLAAAGCSEEESEESAGDPEGEGSVQLEERPAQDPQAESAPGGKPRITVPGERPPGELEVKDLAEGDGPVAGTGSQLSVDYVGVAYSTGQEFDSNFGSGQPFVFQLGGGMVIPGWDRGLEGMKVGGRRQLTIPPELAYGAQGFPPDIAPNETLIFVIDLLDVQ